MNTNKFTVYQVITRLFGNTKTLNKPFGTKEENGVGKFSDFTDQALSEIKALGITHIWYTGVIEHGFITAYPEHGIDAGHVDIVKGRAGSPYAVRDYYDVNPDLADDVGKRMEEFEQLVQRTHQHGMKVLIDFVPNHVARDYKSDQKPEGVQDLGEGDDVSQPFSTKNDFYYFPNHAFEIPDGASPAELADVRIPYEEFPARATGNDHFSPKPSINDWYETVKLNYGIDYLNGKKEHFEPIPSVWHKMKDILVFWAKNGVDGFRCDMGEMVPTAFWNWVIRQIKAVNPEIIFIAEVYDASRYKEFLEKASFDYLYDKSGLYDILREVIVKGVSASEITGAIHHLDKMNDRMLRFLENHDEDRIASAEFAGDATKAIPAMIVTACIHKGPVMLYFGQEVGEPARGKEGFGGDDGKTTIFDYWGVPEHQKWLNQGKFDGGLLSNGQKKLRSFYQKLLNLSISQEAIREGELYVLQVANFENRNYDHHKVYSFIRFSENQCLLVIVNFDYAFSKVIELLIPQHAFETMHLNYIQQFEAKDLLNGEKFFTFSTKAAITQGIHLPIQAGGGYVFELWAIEKIKSK